MSNHHSDVSTGHDISPSGRTRAYSPGVQCCKQPAAQHSPPRSQAPAQWTLAVAPFAASSTVDFEHGGADDVADVDAGDTCAAGSACPCASGAPSSRANTAHRADCDQPPVPILIMEERLRCPFFALLDVDQPFENRCFGRCPLPRVSIIRMIRHRGEVAANRGSSPHRGGGGGGTRDHRSAIARAASGARPASCQARKSGCETPPREVKPRRAPRSGQHGMTRFFVVSGLRWVKVRGIGRTRRHPKARNLCPGSNSFLTWIKLW